MMNFGLDQSIRLCHGAGNGKNSACWMTAVSVYAGKNAWKDQPECVAPTIRAFAIRLNDSMPDDETRGRLIGPHLFAPVGTARMRADGSFFEPQDVADKRRMIALRFVFHKALPLVYRAMGFEEQACTMESVKLDSMSDRANAREVARRVREFFRARYFAYAADAYAADAYAVADAADAAAAAAYAAAAAAAAAYAADAAADAADAAARALRLAATAMPVGSGPVVGGVGGGVGNDKVLTLTAACDRVYELGVECVLEMCAVDSSAPVEPDLSGVSRVRKVVCHA